MNHSESNCEYVVLYWKYYEFNAEKCINKDMLVLVQLNMVRVCDVECLRLYVIPRTRCREDMGRHIRYLQVAIRLIK